MYKELNEFASVFSGYSFRKSINPNKNGEISVFQPKDLVQGQYIDTTESLVRISESISEYTGFLKKNDVLLVARGMKSGSFRTAIFSADEKNVIASSSLLVIRLMDSIVLPEFLSLFLNSQEGQDAIVKIVTGSYIGAVPRRELERIKIPILSLERQKTFIKMERNIREQQRIANRQSQIRQNIINATFRNLITT